jgi:Heterokaryon incompatibility protein (HET)
MGKVYSLASKVIAWLGPDADDGEYALSMFGQMTALAEEFPTDFEWVRRMPGLCNPGTHETDEVAEEKLGNALCRALRLLFERPFWGRIWTIQERALAQDLLYMCGSTAITAAITEINQFKTIAKLTYQRPQFLSPYVWIGFYGIPFRGVSDIALHGPSAYIVGRMINQMLAFSVDLLRYYHTRINL